MAAGGQSTQTVSVTYGIGEAAGGQVNETSAPPLSPCSQERHWSPSRIDVDKIPEQRVDFIVPLLAAEHTVMADPGLHVMHSPIGAHAGAELLGSNGLPD